MYNNTQQHQQPAAAAAAAAAAAPAIAIAFRFQFTTLITCLAIVIQHLSIQGNEEPFPSLLYYMATLLHDLFFCPTSTNTSTTASARYHVLRILSTFLLLHRTLLALSFFGVPHLPTPVQYNNNNGKSKTPLP